MPMLEINDGILTLPDHKGQTAEEWRVANGKEEGEYTPTSFLTGVAGSGKSYQLSQALLKDPMFAKLTASTGIAAMNTGAITVHSQLKFSTADSIKEAFIRRRLHRELKTLKEARYRWLVIDEVSMLHRDIFEYIYLALNDVNSEETDTQPLGLLVTGDMAQLAPIPNKLKDANGFPIMERGREKKEPTPWVFQSPEWKRFEENGIKLTKIFRQSDPTFLNALNAARRGQGGVAVGLLKQAGVKFQAAVNMKFEGTTLIPKNDEVDGYNLVRLREIQGEEFTVKSQRWWIREYKSPSEWENIPDKLPLRIGAYLMILSNDVKEWKYCNGSCGWLRKVNKDPVSGEVLSLGIELVGKELSEQQKDFLEHPEKIAQWEREHFFKFDDGLVYIRAITRKVKSHSITGEEKERLAKMYNREVYDAVVNSGADGPDRDESIEALLQAYFDEEEEDLTEGYTVGAITYFPVKHGWATTIHKCVAPETNILTLERGLIKIGEVQKGEHVFTGTNYKPVTEVANTTRRAFRVTTVNGYELICSGDHPLMTPQGMVDTRELEPGDGVLAKTSNYTDRETPINPEIAWFLGVMVGDGSYNDQDEGQLHITTESEFLQQRLLKVFESLDRKASIRSDGRGIHSTSKPFRELLLSWGLDYKTATEKEVPFIVARSADTAKAFLQGLFDTDGSVGRSFVVFCTRSKRLSQQVQIMLRLLDIPSKRNEFPGVTGPYYQVRVNAEAIPRFKLAIGFSRPYKAAQLDVLRPNRVIKRTLDYDPITAVEDLGIDIPMVDICVDVEHVFYANGLVTHNSQGLTFDQVQIDTRHFFFSAPGMAYVALSRCRTPEGIVLVGQPNDIAKKINADKAIGRFL